MKIGHQQSDSTIVKTHVQDSILHVVPADSARTLKMAQTTDSATQAPPPIVKKSVTSGVVPTKTISAVKEPADTTFFLPSLATYNGINAHSVLLVDSNLVSRYNEPAFSSRSDCYNYGPYSQEVFVEQKPTFHNSGNAKPLEEASIHSGWFFSVIFLLVVGFTSFRLFYGKFFSLILAGVFNSREAERFYSSKTNQFPQIKIITYSILILGIGVLAFNFLNLHNPTFSATFSSLGYLVAITAVYMFYRNIVGSLIRVISDEQEYFQLHDYNLFIYNFVITLIVILSGFFSTYLPTGEQMFPIILGVIISSIVLVFRTIRSFRLFIRNRFSIFYWILYFCALEVLPLAGLYFGFKRLVIIA